MKGLVALVAVVGCAAEDPGQAAQPIYGGTVDTGDPSVVLVFYRDPTNPQAGFICSGTIIGKRTVLTAAHCVQENRDAGKDADGYIYFGNGDWRTDTDNRIVLAGGRYHYDYQFPSNDVGVVYLAEDAPMDPVALNDQPLEELALNGKKLRAVGWGTTNGEVGAGTRRQADIPFVGVASDQIVNAGDAFHGICPGDSGGPLFATIGSVEKQVAITSFGFVPCRAGGAGFGRVDHFVDSFLIPAIDNFEGPCKADGTCVTTGCRTPDPDCDHCGFDLAGACNPDCAVPDQDCPLGKATGAPCTDEFDCESRRCIPALDDPRIKYCTERCFPGIGWCPSPEICQEVGGENVCVIPPPTPGVIGFPCGDGSMCRSGICHPQTRVCVEPCDPAQASSCPSGYECVESSLAPHVCAVAGSGGGGGGCSTTGGGGSPWGLWLVAAVLGLSRRRR